MLEAENARTEQSKPLKQKLTLSINAKKLFKTDDENFSIKGLSYDVTNLKLVIIE